MAVPPEDAVKYGVIEIAERIDERLVRASRIVEKPPLDHGAIEIVETIDSGLALTRAVGGRQ